MLMSRLNTLEQKRDLHFGGLGLQAAPALAAVTDPVRNLTDSWVQRGRVAVRAAEDFVRDYPAAAAVLVGAIGLGLGLLLARQE
jgi:ElaB/YqjD/DUF883 family membrane-anchored ribosome-binding protein